jgi:hypothetical protein
MRSIVEADRPSVRRAPSPAVLLLAPLALAIGAVSITPGGASAQTPPPSFPTDSDFDAVSCLDPTALPSQDPCDDDARDHRNIVGAGTTPAYLTHEDGTYLYLRVRVEDDPRQSGALVAFAWGFGLDSDGDGAFEAYVSLIGQGMADRLEIRDQDASNGTTPDRRLPSGAGADTSLRPIDTTGTGPTWATVTAAPPVGAMANFCPDDTDGGDWYITVAVPLTILRDFGALGGAVAYGGSSSEFSGIQNDFVCADGTPPTCTTGAMCPSGVCLTGIGRCGPSVVPIFLGCVDEDTNLDGIDEGCSAALSHCLVTSTGSSCVECIAAADCSDGNACTLDACTANACVAAGVTAGTTCAGGVCNGSSTAPACVACLDDATGLMLDSGCSAGAPVCDVSGPLPRCTGCLVAADCSDGNACTTDSCTLGACVRLPTPAGVACTGGICSGSVLAPECVDCLDDLPGTMVDTGCSASAPVCDDSGAAPVCAECATAIDCDDGNVCTVDACDAGVCEQTALAVGALCAGGVCDASSACVACVDDATGTTIDTGCGIGAPVCDDSGAVAVCTGCLLDTDCDDLNPCTTDACALGACGGSPLAIASPCPGGVCNGDVTAPACVGCVDDATGTVLDTGCSAAAPICDTSLALPACVECLGDAACDDGNPCTLDACAAGSCDHSGLPTGAMCTGGVCDAGGGASMCVACLDDAPGTDRDSGCTDGSPVCDTSGAAPRCVGCDEDADCDDANECTTDACADGACTPTALAAGTACATGVCDGAPAPVCVGCLDDMLGLGLDSGCSAGTPLCDVSGAAPVCVACISDVDCDDGNDCTVDACTAAACASTPAADGTRCATGVCAGEGTTSMCVACVDDGADATADSGCSASAPLCDVSGAAPVCTPCIDGGAGIDLGCGSPDEVCIASGTTRVCVACEDTGAPPDVDFGCEGGAPICALVLDRPTCVECTVDTECGVDEVCNIAAGACTMRCDADEDCGGVTPACDVPSGMCVECTLDEQCIGRQECGAANECGAPDTDDDGITDDLDLDDDNDGIPDLAELGSDLGGDADGDGIQDFEDADLRGCVDGDADGACDELPRDIDFDGDGQANHLDLDADGDGLTDLREGGGADTDRDGVVDGFADADGNGLDDALMASPLPLPNTDEIGGADFLDVDADGDGLTDVREADGADTDGDGRADGGDADGDGLADVVDPDSGGTGWTGPDTDGDGTPDWRDADSDGDRVPDSTESIDSDHDGAPDRASSGNDGDGDGLDDTFDPDSGGTRASEPDLDGDGRPDWRDPDDDGDGIPTTGEDVDRDGVTRNDDTDRDGTPNYLDPDDDDDEIPTIDEDTNDNGSWADDDGDRDGTPDYLDPDPPTVDEPRLGGFSGGALCSLGHGQGAGSALTLLGLVLAALVVRRRRGR